MPRCRRKDVPPFRRYTRAYPRRWESVLGHANDRSPSRVQEASSRGLHLGPTTPLATTAWRRRRRHRANRDPAAQPRQFMQSPWTSSIRHAWTSPKTNRYRSSRLRRWRRRRRRGRHRMGIGLRRDCSASDTPAGRRRCNPPKESGAPSRGSAYGTARNCRDERTLRKCCF